MELKLHPCTIVPFDSGERGLPSKAWETSEWEIDGRRYLLPPETSSKIWECDDWREIAPSIEFPFSFQITIQDSNSKVSEIAISTLKLFPKNQDFFILPPKGCYVRDIDSDKPWYIEGEPPNPQ